MGSGTNTALMIVRHNTPDPWRNLNRINSMKTFPTFSERTKTGPGFTGGLPRYCFNAVLMTALLAFAAIVFAALATGAAMFATGWHKAARGQVHHG
jgi:hypothetical protein